MYVCLCVSLCVCVCGISGEHCHLELQVRRGVMPNRLEFAKLTKGLYTIRHNVDNGIPETLVLAMFLFRFGGYVGFSLISASTEMEWGSAPTKRVVAETERNGKAGGGQNNEKHA